MLRSLKLAMAGRSSVSSRASMPLGPTASTCRRQRRAKTLHLSTIALPAPHAFGACLSVDANHPKKCLSFLP